MNFSIPILICDEHEDIRMLQRDMLTKHGFFHLVEASSSKEVLEASQKGEHFILIHKNLINGEVEKILSRKKRFLVISQPEDPSTIHLSSVLGVKHIISFPYSSRSLLDKISNLMN